MLSFLRKFFLKIELGGVVPDGQLFVPQLKGEVESACFTPVIVTISSIKHICHVLISVTSTTTLNQNKLSNAFFIILQRVVSGSTSVKSVNDKKDIGTKRWLKMWNRAERKETKTLTYLPSRDTLVVSCSKIHSFTARYMLQPVNKSSKKLELTVRYYPISIGLLRLMSNMEEAMTMLHGFGEPFDLGPLLSGCWQVTYEELRRQGAKALL